MLRRPLPLLVALLLALQTLLHAFCMPMPGGAGGSVPLCTPHGIALVPAEPDNPPDGKPDCPACQTGQCAAAYTPPARAAIVLPVETPRDAVQAAQEARVPVRFARNGFARGPPPAG